MRFFNCCVNKEKVQPLTPEQRAYLLGNIIPTENASIKPLRVRTKRPVNSLNPQTPINSSNVNETTTQPHSAPPILRRNTLEFKEQMNPVPSSTQPFEEGQMNIIPSSTDSSNESSQSQTPIQNEDPSYNPLARKETKIYREKNPLEANFLTNTAKSEDQFSKKLREQIKLKGNFFKNNPFEMWRKRQKRQTKLPIDQMPVSSSL